MYFFTVSDAIIKSVIYVSKSKSSVHGSHCNIIGIKMSKLQRLQQIATQMDIEISGDVATITQRIWKVTDDRKKAIFLVNVLRDHLVKYRELGDVGNYLYCEEDIEDFDTVDESDEDKYKRFANTIVSALAFRFDDGADDDDYKKWSNKELLMAMKSSLKLPNWNFKGTIERLVDRYPIKTKQLVKSNAVNYIFQNNYDGVPTEMWDELFIQLDYNIFVKYDGMFMINMHNWEPKSLVIALILLGAEYPITESSLSYDRFISNTSLKILTEKKNPFKRNAVKSQPLSLIDLAANTLKEYKLYSEFAKSPLSILYSPPPKLKA
jgi:hypothetical protein